MMDDVLTFADDLPSRSAFSGQPWKILIADDEPSVHLVTKLALGDFTFEGRPLELLSTYGEDDTRKVITDQPDIALILLDVVMDTMNSGFDLVRYIREDLKNKDVRIIMRTGQSGNAPEDRIIISYDINDFKDKTELTVAKLRTTMISSLRTYSHLKIIAEEQRKSAASRTYLRTIINSLSSVVVTLDQDFKILLWNTQAEVWTKLSADQATGQVLWSLCPVFLPLKALSEEVLKNGHAVERSNVPMQNEGQVYVNFSIQPLEGGQGPELLLRLDDRTEDKHRDEHLSRSQKLSTFSSLASGFTQELNTVLTNLKQEAEGLLGDPHPTLKHIQSLSLQASGMISKIVRFSQNQDRERSKLDLAPLLAEGLARAAIPATIDLSFQPPTVPAEVWGNSEDLRLVIDNLLANAIDALTWMPGVEALTAPRRIELQLDNFQPTAEDRRQHPEMAVGPNWRISLQDTGVGMGPEVAAQAFDPYFTTKPQERGIGLGLSLAFTIVELHGGFIELNSELGKGTTVQIYLPQFAAASQKLEAPEQAQGYILLCDDDPMMRQVAGKILRKLGYQVLEASDGASAIEAFRQNITEIHLVILDMILPGMTGLEVFRELRQIQPQIPVLLSSGFGRGEPVMQALDEGVAGFLQKPFGFESLGQAVQKALTRTSS